MERAVRVPLSLEQLARLNVAVAGSSDKETWNAIVKKSLPTKLQEELLFLFEICSHSRFPFKRAHNLKQVVLNLLYTAINIPLELFRFEHIGHTSVRPNPRRVAELIEEYIHYLRVSMAFIVRRANKIMLNNAYILQYVIKKTTNLTLLNNLLILSTAYRRIEIVRYCIEEGADDFQTASRVALLVDPEQYISHILQNARPSRRCFRLRNLDQDMHHYYYTRMERTRAVVPYQRFLAEAWLKRLFRKSDPFCNISQSVGNLLVNLSDWPNDNVFRSLNHVGLHTLESLKFFYFYEKKREKKDLNDKCVELYEHVPFNLEKSSPSDDALDFEYL